MLNQINHFNTIGDLTGFALYFNMSFVMLGCIPIPNNAPQIYGWVALYDELAYYGVAHDATTCVNITTMFPKMPIKSINKYDFTTSTANTALDLMGGYLANFYMLGELKYSFYLPLGYNNTNAYHYLTWYNDCNCPQIKAIKFPGGMSLTNPCINEIGGGSFITWNIFDCANHYFKKFKSTNKLTD
ncbi:hypothetical protein F-LCD7_0233 [Faustovirus]|nr:hypothetical protein F-LCD7_0233 [Faustovirus]